MKLKLVSAACLALCSVGSFAVTVTPSCPVTPTANDLINKCTPEVTFYIGGASAQANALKTAVLTPDVLFDSTKPFAKVRDTALSISGSGSTTVALAAGKDGNTVAWVGYGASTLTGGAAGKRLAVIYNKANGSFAGVNQLFVPKTTEAENVTLQLTTAKEQKAGTGKAVSCGTSAVAADTVAASTTSLGYATFECASEAAFSTAWGGDKAKAMSLALADVRPSEATPGIYGGLIGKWKPASFPAVTTGMQGFGVIVSPSLYTAMIAKQVADGVLPSSCTSSETVNSTVDVITAACQPNLTKAAYTSLVTGNATSVAAFLGNTDTTSGLILARRTDSSGTQAASNIFFANQAATAAKSALRATDTAPDVLAGAADPAVANVVGNLSVYAKTATGDVTGAVGAATGYAIGVASLDNGYTTTKSSSGIKGALFVKIDGISPNFVNGALEAKQRGGIIAGYPFVYAMQALTSAKLADPYKSLATAITTELQNPVANLTGIAYIGSTDTTKNTPFLRTQAADPAGKVISTANYAPLSK
jgi:hypothetical protein